MLRDDPNKSCAKYLLTSDDKYAGFGTNFSPNQLLCRKYLAMFFFVKETFEKEKDQVSLICRYRTNLGDFRHCHTMILKVYIVYERTWKRAKIAEGNSTTCEWIFHQLAAKNLKVNSVQRSIASVTRYSIGKKKIKVFVSLTSQNRGLSGLKNIWLVIMTGDLLSVILSLVSAT